MNTHLIDSLLVSLAGKDPQAQLAYLRRHGLEFRLRAIATPNVGHKAWREWLEARGLTEAVVPVSELFPPTPPLHSLQ